MKNFDDFLATLPLEVQLEIEDEILAELSAKYEPLGIEDPGKALTFFNREFATKISLEYLRRYHLWANA